MHIDLFWVMGNAEMRVLVTNAAPLRLPKHSVSQARTASIFDDIGELVGPRIEALHWRALADLPPYVCFLYTSDAADDLHRFGVGGRRVIEQQRHNVLRHNRT